MSMLLSVALVCLSAKAAAIPVILDTDIGDDIDDTWALCMMLGTPELDLKLITTASDNTPKKTLLAAKILQAVGRTEIPLGTGKKTSDNAINQEAWLGDYSLAGYPGKVHEDGVQALIDAIHASPAPITICVIGPQTNLAEALTRDPSIAQKARIVSMAGSVYIGYGGKQGAQPEWNVIHDLESAKKVFAAPWDIIIAPLDICGTLIMKGERFQKLAASAAPRAKTVMDNYRQWTNFKNYPEGESSVLFDTVAVYLCHAEAWAEMETLKLIIDDKGQMAVSPEGRPVKCALRWKEEEAFQKHLLKTLK